MTVLLVALGAAVGAPLRYLTDRAIQARHDTVFPWGTFTVNITGSAILGFLTGLPTDPALAALIGTGFCGALTTYSTFSYETLWLAQERARFYALANVAAGIVAGLGAAYAGLALAQAVTA
ncbi:fluoride efflux transporter CrcB [Amycolatopsis thermoflava]|uniref:fluoride efflux transporter CrcB n=1 Tax=Amycolatopsis thermoflava TaxID=84480 RepID=UPI003D7180E6